MIAEGPLCPLCDPFPEEPLTGVVEIVSQVEVLAEMVHEMTRGIVARLAFRNYRISDHIYM